MSDSDTANIDKDKLSRFRAHLRVWATVNFRDFPWRHNKDPYALLVAEFLLQQTEASRVVPIYYEFLKRYPTTGALACASGEEIFNLG